MFGRSDKKDGSDRTDRSGSKGDQSSKKDKSKKRRTSKKDTKKVVFESRRSSTEKSQSQLRGKRKFSFSSPEDFINYAGRRGEGLTMGSSVDFTGGISSRGDRSIAKKVESRDDATRDEACNSPCHSMASLEYDADENIYDDQEKVTPRSPRRSGIVLRKGDLTINLEDTDGMHPAVKPQLRAEAKCDDLEKARSSAMGAQVQKNLDGTYATYLDGTYATQYSEDPDDEDYIVSRARSSAMGSQVQKPGSSKSSLKPGSSKGSFTLAEIERNEGLAQEWEDFKSMNDDNDPYTQTFDVESNHRRKVERKVSERRSFARRKITCADVLRVFVLWAVIMGLCLLLTYSQSSGEEDSFLTNERCSFCNDGYSVHFENEAVVMEEFLVEGFICSSDNSDVEVPTCQLQCVPKEAYTCGEISRLAEESFTTCENKEESCRDFHRISSQCCHKDSTSHSVEETAVFEETSNSMMGFRDGGFEENEIFLPLP